MHLTIRHPSNRSVISKFRRGNQSWSVGQMVSYRCIWLSPPAAPWQVSVVVLTSLNLHNKEKTILHRKKLALALAPSCLPEFTKKKLPLASSCLPEFTEKSLALASAPSYLNEFMEKRLPLALALSCFPDFTEKKLALALALSSLPEFGFTERVFTEICFPKESVGASAEMIKPLCLLTEPVKH